MDYTIRAGEAHCMLHKNTDPSSYQEDILFHRAVCISRGVRCFSYSSTHRTKLHLGLQKPTERKNDIQVNEQPFIKQSPSFHGS